MTLPLDPVTGRVIRTEGCAARHPIDKVVGYGIAAHEGQLFGLANQLLGVLTAIGLITLSVSGLVIWWRRRPQGQLGAPPALQQRPRAGRPEEPRLGVALQDQRRHRARRYD